MLGAWFHLQINCDLGDTMKTNILQKRDVGSRPGILSNNIILYFVNLFFLFIYLII